MAYDKNVQSQINNWFSANPNASASQIQSTLDSYGATYVPGAAGTGLIQFGGATYTSGAPAPAPAPVTSSAPAPTTTWQQNVDTWNSQNPSATSTQIAKAAEDAGGKYDSGTGTYSYQGQTYKPQGVLSTPATTFNSLSGNTTALSDMQNYYNKNSNVQQQYGSFDKALGSELLMGGDAGDELQAYYASMTPENYAKIPEAVRGWVTAPQTQTTPSTSTPAGTNYQPNLNQQVDYNTMTIEGRINNLMTSPTVRQAGERAMAMFAGRGLLNSSMAIEAANEAMISKAIEIAGPDAETYFKQSNINQDWTNKFAQNQQAQEYNLQNMGVQQQYAKELKSLDQAFQSQNLDKQQSFALQQNYLQSVGNFENQYNQAIMAIQSTEMPPEQKTAAIEYMTAQRDNNVFMITKAFEVMPTWQAEWSKLSHGVDSAPQGVDVTKGPEAHTRLQVYNAIQYAAQDPSYMNDAQFDQWAQAAVNMGLISQNDYNALKAA